MAVTQGCLRSSGWGCFAVSAAGQQKSAVFCIHALNAEGILQAVPKGFFPVRCVLVVIQRASGSRQRPSIAMGGGLELSETPKLVLWAAGA